MFFYLPEMVYDKFVFGISNKNKHKRIKEAEIYDIINNKNNSLNDNNDKSINKDIDIIYSRCFDNEFNRNKRITLNNIHNENSNINRDNSLSDIKKSISSVSVCKNAFTNMSDFKIQYYKTLFNHLKNEELKNKKVERRIINNASQNSETLGNDDFELNNDSYFSVVGSIKDKITTILNLNSDNISKDNIREKPICSSINTCYNAYFDSKNKKIIDREIIIRCSIEDQYTNNLYFQKKLNINTYNVNENMRNINNISDNNNLITKEIDYKELEKLINQNYQYCLNINN